MPLFLAKVIAYLLMSYAAIGVGVAAWAHARGLDTHDPDVRGGSWGFRVLITPGVIALWPLLLGSLRRQGGLRPAPYSAPHDGSRSRLPYRVQPSLMALTMLAALALFVMGWLTLGATPGT